MRRRPDVLAYLRVPIGWGEVALAGVIILLLWFYLSGLAILVEAEMNAEIEHASPYGKAQRSPHRHAGVAGPWLFWAVLLRETSGSSGSSV